MKEVPFSKTLVSLFCFQWTVLKVLTLRLWAWALTLGKFSKIIISVRVTLVEKFLHSFLIAMNKVKLALKNLFENE